MVKMLGAFCRSSASFAELLPILNHAPRTKDDG